MSLHSQIDTHSTSPTANTIFDADSDSECFLSKHQISEDASQPEQIHIQQLEHQVDTIMLSPNDPLPTDTAPNAHIGDQESHEPPTSNVKPSEVASQLEQINIQQSEHQVDTVMLSPCGPLPPDTATNAIIGDQESFSVQEPPTTNVKPSLPDITVNPIVADDCTENIWGIIPYNELYSKIDQIYDEIVF